MSAPISPPAGQSALPIVLAMVYGAAALAYLALGSGSWVVDAGAIGAALCSTAIGIVSVSDLSRSGSRRLLLALVLAGASATAVVAAGATW